MIPKSAHGTTWRWILRGLEKLLSWARIKCKLKMSRSLVVRIGRVIDAVRFEVQGERTSPVTEQPVKCLGKWYDSTINYTGNTRKKKSQAREWIKLIQTSGLPGKFKIWCYHYGTLPWLQWPMLIYEIMSNAAEELDQNVSKHLRRWLYYKGTTRTDITSSVQQISLLFH